MKKMETLPERLETALKAANRTRPELVEKTGLSRQAVNKWFDGESANLKMDHLFKVADFLGVNARWLATGDGSDESAARAIEPQERAANRVSDNVATYGHGVTKDGMSFAREWQKLREPLKTQIQTMVETLVAEQVRAESKQGKGPKGPKSSPSTRPNA